MPKTLFEKIWDKHVVTQQDGAPAVLYIDLHLVHEVTSPQAFTGLRERGLKVRRPDKTLATMDHSIPTTPIDVPIADAMALAQIKQMETNAAEFGITLHCSSKPRMDVEQIHRYTDRDKYLTAAQAVEVGLIDAMLEPQKKKDDK